PSFLVQATIIGVLAQRLVRRICPNCREPFEIDTRELSSLGLDLGREGKLTLFRGRGCIRCRGTGYFGRSGILEVLPFTESIKRLITAEADQEAIRVQARREGMVTLRENAVKKVLEGKTTYEEAIRVTWEQM
ncbi:MAG: type II/IV secretion system protein, partial [Deltaproteobacteria bacterium]|nr:type II/IV secretion system protein [Deltaproteobacteria bacterium]